MTLGETRNSNRKTDDTSRKDCSETCCTRCRTTSPGRIAGKAEGTGSIGQSAGRPAPDAITGIPRRAFSQRPRWAGSGRDPAGCGPNNDHLAHGDELVCQRTGDNERSVRSIAFVDRSVSPLGSTTDSAASSPISGAPADEASRQSPILSIRETMAAAARALRDKPCPTGHCPRCYAGACRLLIINQCICTGHIDPTNKTKFFQ